jgi:hypothetical protein
MIDSQERGLKFLMTRPRPVGNPEHVRITPLRSGFSAIHQIKYARVYLLWGEPKGKKPPTKRIELSNQKAKNYSPKELNSVTKRQKTIHQEN